MNGLAALANTLLFLYFRAACAQITLKLSYWRVRGLRDGEHFDEGSNVYIITFVIYG